MKNLLISALLLSASASASADTTITCKQGSYSFEINLDDIEGESGLESSYSIFEDGEEIESGTYTDGRHGYVSDIRVRAYVYNFGGDNGISIGTRDFGGRSRQPTIGIAPAKAQGKIGVQQITFRLFKSDCQIDVRD